MKTAFFGTPDFAVPSLEVLAAASTVVAVYCQPDKPAGRGMQLRPPPVKRRALELGLPVQQPRSVKKAEFVDGFRSLGVELAVVAAYGRILPRPLLEAAPLGFVNVHASLLPRLRGAAPIHRAVLDGEPRSGVAIMQVTEGLDEGPVFLDAAVALDAATTAGSLHDRLATLGAELLSRFLAEVARRGALPPATPQDHARATHAGKLDPAEFPVDWTRPAPEVDRRIRGLSPFPGAYTSFRGERLGLVLSRLAEGSGAPGTVLGLEADGPRVACGSGAVVLTRVKPAGKRELEARAWWNGARLAPGERLGQGG